MENNLPLPNYVCIFNSGMSKSYTNQRDKSNDTGYISNNRGFGERNSDSATASVNQVIQLLAVIPINILNLNHHFFVGPFPSSSTFCLHSSNIR